MGSKGDMPELSVSDRLAEVMINLGRITKLVLTLEKAKETMVDEIRDQLQKEIAGLISSLLMLSRDLHIDVGEEPDFTLKRSKPQSAGSSSL